MSEVYISYTMSIAIYHSDLLLVNVKLRPSSQGSVSVTVYININISMPTDNQTTEYCKLETTAFWHSLLAYYDGLSKSVQRH